MENEMKQVLRIVAKQQAEWIRSSDRATKDVLLEDGLGGVLREKLLRLLEAGQKMRDWKPAWEDGQEWDAALAAVKEKVHA